MSDIAKLPFHDRVEIVGQALALAAGVKPGKVNPWAADYHRRGDLSLAGVMATLGQSPAGFMSSPDLASSISEAVRIIALEAERPRDLTHRVITRLVSVPDFKVGAVPRANPINLVELDHTGAVPTLSASIAEAELSGMKTFGGILSLTRQAIINAEWPLVTSLVEELTQAAYRQEAAAVFGLLASNPTLPDGTALFHADRGNIATTGGAPSSSTVESSIQALVNMSVGGIRLGLKPWAIVAPVGIGCTLAMLFEKGLARLLPGGFYATPELTGTAWYLLPDPAQRPVIGLAHIGTGTEPLVDTQEGFRSDGLGIRCRHSFAAVALSPFAVRNEGQ